MRRFCIRIFLLVPAILFLAVPWLVLIACARTDRKISAPRARGLAGSAALASTSAEPAANADDAAPQRGRDPAYGQMLYANSCIACHGPRGQGMPHQGVNLRTSKFVAIHSDDQLIEFLKKGRAPNDPSSLEGRLMPARGGNATLDDRGLGDVVAFLRQVQDDARRDDQAAGQSASSVFPAEVSP